MNMIPFEGQVALVTGAAHRLGRVIALRLAEEGADVVVHYRSSKTEAAEVVAGVRATGRRAWAVEADLEDAEAATDLMGHAVRAAGRHVSLVVNNASRFPVRALSDATYEDVDAMMRLHAWAPLTISRSLQQQLPDDSNGAVVNLLDTRIASHDPQHVPYMVSKRALADLTRTLAWELAPNVRVNGVAPGAVLAPEGEDEGYLERMRDGAPLHRLPKPDEIAHAVAYLLATPSVTGQVLFVDAGRHLQ